MKRVNAFIIFGIVFLLIPIVHAQSASIKANNGVIQNLYFTGDSTNPNKWYQDAIGNNPDVGIEVCDVGQTYVGTTYALNVNGNWKYALVSYRSDTQALAFTDINNGGGCYFTSPGYLTFSPSHLATPSPNVYYAAFPGRLWVAYSNTGNPGTLSNFIYVGSNGYLRGSYNVERSFSQSTKQISVSTPSIMFQTFSGSFSKQASDSDFGVNTDRKMVVGVCDDDHGSSCHDGRVVPNEGNFPFNLNAGVTSVDDQHKYDRYVVINGLGNYICIGANLKITINSVQPNPVYYSQNLQIQYTVSNPRDTPYEEQGGNVDVTTPFTVRTKIYQQGNSSNVVYQNDYVVSAGIPVDGSVSNTLTWQAIAHSGTYVVEVTVDVNGNIVECNENDNVASKTFELKPIHIPVMYINGNRTDTFPYAGMPYNFSMYLKNSDNESVSNALVRIVEENGISLFAPTQIWNRTTNGTDVNMSGLKSYNMAQFYTDYYGNTSFTIIPTGNRLYAAEYAHYNVNDYVGNYRIYLEGTTHTGDNLVFIINGSVAHEYPLSIANPYTYTSPIEENALINENVFVRQIMDWVYAIFANFWKSVSV